MSLTRFHDAQEGVWERALAELEAGAKTSHWMWFIFPQLASLGRSGTAKYYGIADLSEARAYLADPVLKKRLDACRDAMLRHGGQKPEAVLGPVDALKLRSCATLFLEAGGGPEWQAVLDRFYGGQGCPLTLKALSGESEGPA